MTCQNKVDGAIFPQLQAAVEASIVDWDWHLAILNEQYNVDWNMTSVSNTYSDAMIEFVTMTNAQAEIFISEYEGEDFQMTAGLVACTTYWNNGDPIKKYTENWTNCKIVLFYENMQLHYTSDTMRLIDDYYTLQVIVNHELGHALGLDEYKANNGVIMYPYYDLCTADVPTAADLNGIYAIYG